MTQSFRLGAHELRFFPVTPLLIYIRFCGDLSTCEARSLSQLVAREAAGRAIRFLIDASALGSIRPDSRRELLASDADPPRVCPILDIVLVGATLLHKVVIAQIVSAPSPRIELRGELHFLDALDDGLRWLGLPQGLVDDI